MSKVHQLVREQFVRTSVEKAWAFLSSPRNLEAITPPDLSFRILTDLPEQMREGQLIEYEVGIPMLGKQRWLTEIKHVQEGRSFVDEQRVGPYALWYHYHAIEAAEGGVRLRDEVTYVMPFGPLGAIAHAVFVRRMLERIFDYRRVAVEELMAESTPRAITQP